MEAVITTTMEARRAAAAMVQAKSAFRRTITVRKERTAMSTELNLEAEGAARVEGLLDALDAMQRDPALCKYHGVLRHAELTIAARRAAPSAPMVEELPALPTEAQLRHALKEIPLCYPWGTGRKLVREGTSLDWVSQRESTGSNTQLADMNKNFVNSTIAATVAVMTSYIAPYAERIRVLERELAERKTASIDTAEFRNLLGDMLDAYRKELQGGPQRPYEKARAKFVAYIDGRTAGAAPEVPAPEWAGEFKSFADWVNRAQRALASPSHLPAICVDAKGRRCTIGKDFMLARDEGAFPVRYFWEFAAAPSPQHGKEGGND
jgi:hypothetical protein